MNGTKTAIKSKSWWSVVLLTIMTIPWGELIPQVGAALEKIFPEWSPVIQAVIAIVLFLLGHFGVMGRKSKVAGVLRKPRKVL